MFDYEAFRLKMILNRRKLKLTQAELGELSEISEKNISKLELGKHTPKLKTAIAILNAFNTTLLSFMTDENNDKKMLIENIDNYLLRMDSKERQLVSELAKQLARKVE